MAHEVTAQELIDANEKCWTSRPHVVVLGAGASLAAFPSGDARGHRLPLMNNLIEVLGLQSLVAEAGYDSRQNFEALYSELHSSNPESELLRRIEEGVMEYFSELVLPDHLTIYDLLLLSLRKKDAVFTFNWDPFLVDAYIRNLGQAPLPDIFHLHGNVRLGFCAKCGRAMSKGEKSHNCDGQVAPSRLLYPIEKKDYASDPFIATQWDHARNYIRNAAIITIFGYSAPTTDKEAMSIFTDAWKGDADEKLVERLEIIDIRDSDELSNQWHSFAFFDHYDLRRSFYQSLLAHYPRRTCEALGHRGYDGCFVEAIPWAGNLAGLQRSLDDLVFHEARSQ